MAARTQLNLRRISALCGFSTCTVSRVLSGRAREFRITAETEQKILKVASEAGYRPNYLAHSLNTGRTHTIGLMLANRVDNYLGGILDGVEARLRGTPNRIVVATCENDPDIQRRELDAFAYRKVDGIILYPLAHAGRAPRTASQQPPRAPDLPAVIIGRQAAWKTDEVMLNDEQAGREAARRALRSGARRFAVLTHRNDCSSDHNRVVAFRDEIRRAGHPTGAVTVVEDGFQQKPLPARLDRVEAFFGVNSRLLLDLVAQLRSSGHAQAKYFVSVGEIEGRDLLSLAVDTLPMPGRALGVQAADLMLWRLDHPGEPLQHRIVDFEIETLPQGGSSL